MRINFDFVDLEAFLAVQEFGSFHLASERLGMSQSAVTRRIKKLETALGSQLFHRTTREVKLTLAGKRLRARAELILSETRETARAIQDESVAFEHQMLRSITIATVPTMVPGVIAPALRALSEAEPRIRFRLLDLAANEVAEAVAQGEADIGLCSLPALEPTTTFEFLFDDPIVVALPKSHPLASKEVLTWSDLSGMDLILPSRDTGNRVLIDDAMARAGLRVVWTIEVSRTTTAMDCVVAGLGLAPLPRSAAKFDQGLDVTFRPLTAPLVARPIGLLVKAGKSDSALSQNMTVELRRAVNSYVSTTND